MGAILDYHHFTVHGKLPYSTVYFNNQIYCSLTHMLYSIRVFDCQLQSNFCHLGQSVTLQNFTLWYGMVIWWPCWHRTILIRNITQKQYSQFPPVHDFGKPWWGVAYVPCMTNLRALCAWVIRWHVTCMLSLAEHWQGRRALSNHVCAHSVISMWHVVCLQHLARACSEQSRSTTVLPINHVIQMPQCLSGFVNHDYCVDYPRARLCLFVYL